MNADTPMTDQNEDADDRDDLVGFVADYVYPNGLHYVLSVERDKLDFFSPWPGEERAGPPEVPQSPAGVNAPDVTGGVDYRARKIREGLYMVHWIVNWEIHVTLLLDFERNRTICGALMPGKTELWDEASWDRWMIPAALKQYGM